MLVTPSTDLDKASNKFRLQLFFIASRIRSYNETSLFLVPVSQASYDGVFLVPNPLMSILNHPTATDS